jgi:hypothetical protein
MQRPDCGGAADFAALTLLWTARAYAVVAALCLDRGGALSGLLRAHSTPNPADSSGIPRPVQHRTKSGASEIN